MCLLYGYDVYLQFKVNKFCCQTYILSLIILLCSIQQSVYANQTTDEKTGDEWMNWSNEERVKQLSPSIWHPNQSPQLLGYLYSLNTHNWTLQARNRLECQLNIAYGQKPNEKYDIYGTDLHQDSLIFVFIHGGYWQEGNKYMAGFLSLNLYSIHYKNVVLGYTLAPNATITEMIQELKNALQHLMKRFVGAKFVIGGHSAGAQIAAMMMHDSDPISFTLLKQIVGFVLVSGVYDLRLLVDTPFNEKLNLTTDTASALSPLRIRKLNDAIISNATSFQVLIMCGNYDSPEFQRQSIAYYNILNQTLQAELWISPVDDHFSVVTNMGIPEMPAGNKLREFLMALQIIK